MLKKFEASVIISYYRNLPNLEIILDALNRQTVNKGFEVIIAEDDEGVEVINFLADRKTNYNFPILHVMQEDKGFRKCKILNVAIRESRTDFLIFIDGDCIPHPRFVSQYINAKTKGNVLYGRRVMLGKNLSSKILKNKNLKVLRFFNLLFSDSKRKEEGFFFPLLAAFKRDKKKHRLLGCNMGIFKSNMEAINGFDEDYEFPGGGEDSDIEWRLERLKNVKFYPMKFKSLVYHLYHKERFSSKMEQENFRFMKNKIDQGRFFCKNGLIKLH